MRVAGADYLVLAVVVQDKGSRMSCFWRHKWGKWEQYQVEIFYPDMPTVNGVANKQKRKCLVCDYQQIEDVG